MTPSPTPNLQYEEWLIPYCGGSVAAGAVLWRFHLAWAGESDMPLPASTPEVERSLAGRLPPRIVRMMLRRLSNGGLLVYRGGYLPSDDTVAAFAAHPLQKEVQP